MLAALMGSEILLASLAFDGDQLKAGTGGLLGLLKSMGAWAMRWTVAAAVLFAGFAYLKGHTVPLALLGSPIRPHWLLAHAAALAGFVYASQAIYEGGAGTDLAVLAWSLAGAAVAVTAACTVLPPVAWAALGRQTRSLALLSMAAAGLACGLGVLTRLLWAPVTVATFALVKFLLGLVLNEMVVQPERFRVGTPKFTVIVSPECSGLEGMGLFFIFSLLWLVLFRDELRFPQVLILLPVGLVTLYFLNAVRIAALALIGHAGFREIAVRGFHSQAGWIGFSLVAFGLLLASRRVAWISARPLPPLTADEYPAAAYLVPFLALLAAGILSQAMTAHFEWTYALRVLATAVVLWFYRARYQSIDWRCGWVAVAAGALMFALWIAVDRWVGPATPTGMPAELIGASAGARWAWIVARIAGAVVTVPIAEELAFRGFLFRRCVAEDFEAVPWRAWTWTALGLSSCLFGIPHGSLWFAGILAGLAFGTVMVRSGRLGDAVGAHATTNALLAAYVLMTGRWDLW